MSRSEIDFLNHILDEMVFLGVDIKSFTYEQFIGDKKTILAYTRSLEIIGEAIKNLPDELRLRYPQINWKGFSGLRDIIIHQYFGIDYEIIWETIVHEIPEVTVEIQRILRYEENK